MKKRDAYIALGSNIDPEANLPAAVVRLAELIEVAAASTVYETEPVGAPGAPRFLNAALRVRWAGTPHRLRGLLRRVEAELGRVRTVDPNAPRTIDLDLALVPGLRLEDPGANLFLPDPEIPRRAHLAVPLAEIAGAETYPATGESLAAIAAALEGAGMRPRADVSLP